MEVIKIMKKDESDSFGFKIGYTLELENGKVVYAQTPKMDWNGQEFNSNVDDGDINYLENDVFGHPEGNPPEFEGESPSFHAAERYNGVTCPVCGETGIRNDEEAMQDHKTACRGFKEKLMICKNCCGDLAIVIGKLHHKNANNTYSIYRHDKNGHLVCDKPEVS